jgi:hypothetical protein
MLPAPVYTICPTLTLPYVRDLHFLSATSAAAAKTTRESRVLRTGVEGWGVGRWRGGARSEGGGGHWGNIMNGLEPQDICTIYIFGLEQSEIAHL